MATKEYIIQSEHTSGSTAKHYHGEAISTLNTWAANNIPANAVISNIEVYYSGKLSLGDTKFYVGYTNDSADEPGQKIISDQLTTSQKSWRQPVSFSGRNITSSYSRINVWMSSGIIYKKFTCYSFKIIWTYSIPTYTVTVNAGTGGTVTGGGTYENQAAATLTATAKPGYNFVKWSDGNNSASRTVTVTGNATYTAEFAPQACEVILRDGEGLHGAKATLSGGGQYKFGDTVTVKADIPSNHKLYRWRVRGVNGNYYDYSNNPLTITIDDRFLDGNNVKSTIYIDCYLAFTGYTVKAEIQPEEAGKVKWGVFYAEVNGGVFFADGDVTQEGALIGEDYLNNFWINAAPNEGYEFVEWSDGETANPRQINLTGDATFTARFLKKQHTITLTRTILDGPDDVSDDCYILGGGTYEYGTEVTLEARVNPSSDYEFVIWSDGEESAIRTITVTKNDTYVAIFKRIKCTATFKNYDGTVLETVIVKPGSPPQYMGLEDPAKPSTVEFTYTFSGWEPSVSNIYDDTTYIAQFTESKRIYEISAFASIGGEVIVSGTGEYGTEMTLTAVCQPGYRFVRWGDGETSPIRTFIVTGDASFSALFELDKINVYIGTAKPKSVYVGTQEVKAIYVGTTKV